MGGHLPPPAAPAAPDTCLPAGVCSAAALVSAAASLTVGFHFSVVVVCRSVFPFALWGPARLGFVEWETRLDKDALTLQRIRLHLYG